MLKVQSSMLAALKMAGGKGRIIGAESWGFLLAGLAHEFKAFRNW